MKEIDNIVKKVLLESLNEKAEEITQKIQEKISGEMEEAECKEGDCGEMKEIGFKQGLAKAARKKFGKTPKSLEDKFHLSDFEDDDDMTDVTSGEFDYVAERECVEGNCGEMEEKLHGNQKKIDVAEPKGKITKADFDKLRSMKEEDTEMEEGNAFLGARADAKDQGKKEFEFDGETYPVKESFKYSIQFDGEELVLTENELITMIEEIVLEEKKGNLKSTGKSKGMVEFDRVHKKDEDINRKANQESFKKMKDYAKGYKGSFEENAKHFPKGNGELAKMDKKAYIPSDAVDEYVADFAYPGMTNLTFDEIKPDDEKIKKYLKGDKMTGNSSEYANAVETEVGEKFYKNYENNPYGEEQKNASYKRQNQPVDIAGENKGAKTYKKTKGQKALDKLSENIVTKEKENILSEEMLRMKEMIGYNKKSQ